MPSVYRYVTPAYILLGNPRHMKNLVYHRYRGLLSHRTVIGMHNHFGIVEMKGTEQ